MLRGSQKVKIIIIFKHKEINNGVEPARPCSSKSSQSSGEIDSSPDSDKPDWSGMGREKPRGCEHPVVEDGSGPCCFRVSILARINITNTKKTKTANSFLFVFCHAARLAGSWFPNQRLNPCLQQQNHEVLATGWLKNFQKHPTVYCMLSKFQILF